MIKNAESVTYIYSHCITNGKNISYVFVPQYEHKAK